MTHEQEIVRASGMRGEFKVLEVARWIADEVERLIREAAVPLLDARQLSDAAGGIAANIREGYGRRDASKDRNQFFRFARGSAEETDERLQRNWRAKRISDRDFWRLHNRIAVVVKMLDALGADD